MYRRRFGVRTTEVFFGTTDDESYYYKLFFISPRKMNDCLFRSVDQAFAEKYTFIISRRVAEWCVWSPFSGCVRFSVKGCRLISSRFWRTRAMILNYCSFVVRPRARNLSTWALEWCPFRHIDCGWWSLLGDGCRYIIMYRRHLTHTHSC